MKQILNKNSALIQSKYETTIANKCSIFTDDDVNVILVDGLEKSTNDEGANIKVFIDLENSAKMISAFPYLLDYMKSNEIKVIYDDLGITILLTTLLKEHRQLFLNFNAIITE